LRELGPAVLKFSLAPANNLIAVRFRRAAETDRLEIAPKIFIGDRDKSEVGVIIEPANLSLPPATATALLQTDQRAIE
jgi:hypothetical protein